MREFEAIRPYRDDEVADVMARLVRDPELLQLLAAQRLPRLARLSPGLAKKLVSLGLRREARQIHSVDELQHRVEPYLDKLIEHSTLEVTYSGLEQLDKDQPYLFLANHRDIVMDPAFVNYALYHAGHPTPRIAIGDNLLQRPFVADLMRLNKSFIVHRSLTGRREKLTAYQTLSAYINHSIAEGHSVWIAQAEGRAKDGKDQTDSAIIKMFCMSRKEEPFDEVIHSLSVVPVSIAYEWDPCDQMKAHELAEKGLKGSYTKAPGEDDRSIAMGLTGYKGRVHVAFGRPLGKGIVDAKQAAREVDRQILSSYRLYPSNYLAFERVLTTPGVAVTDWREQFTPDQLATELERFEQRLAACPEAERPYWLLQYANPVISRGLINSR
ncbi:1-acyl-sn-glycerol-3-phosphate acyltransferase [Halopseudomonas salegens]|uniref:Glycerol-3-phosphate acyltransferase n=1 Tax=Halopseudomonas salegens TaxID=1434072 RepID=A0A1H2G0G1_9GAMM|nr:1-acyl-sn-glycerol-3-phosphate acyltransferase [Halopseudomonas salegens]SDU12970.1 glycerol-3-phosphate acyltransferase [Halopseudomonas salegens]